MGNINNKISSVSIKKLELRIRRENEYFITSESMEDKIKHKSQLISYYFLMEIQKQCDKLNINRSELSDMVGLSRASIGQLFIGNRKMHMNMLARFEYALGITFKITLNHDRTPTHNPPRV